MRRVSCTSCDESIKEEAEICPECGVRQRAPDYHQPQQPAPPHQHESTNNPGLAAAASFIIPGLGQVYNGQIAKGIIGGALTILFAVTGVGLLIAIPLWIYLVYNAYGTAQTVS